jgi:hypothetical protein
VVSRDLVHRTPFYYTASSLIVAGSALGPLPLAWAQSWLGDYDRALEALCLIPFALSLLTLTLKNPFRPISAA